MNSAISDIFKNTFINELYEFIGILF